MQAVDEDGHVFTTNLVSVEVNLFQRWVVREIELGQLVIATIDIPQQPVLLVGE